MSNLFNIELRCELFSQSKDGWITDRVQRPFRPNMLVVFGPGKAVIKAFNTVEPSRGHGAVHEKHLATAAPAALWEAGVTLDDFRAMLEAKGSHAARDFIRCARLPPGTVGAAETHPNALPTRLPPMEAGSCMLLDVEGDIEGAAVFGDTLMDATPMIGMDTVGQDVLGGILGPDLRQPSEPPKSAVQQQLLNKVLGKPYVTTRDMYWGCKPRRRNGKWVFQFRFEKCAKVIGIALLNFHPNAEVESIIVAGSEYLEAGRKISTELFRPDQMLASVLERYFEVGDMLQAISPGAPEHRTAHSVGIKEAFNQRTQLPIFAEGQSLVITVDGDCFEKRTPHCDLLLRIPHL